MMREKIKKKTRSIKELFMHRHSLERLCRIFNLQQRLFRRFLKLYKVNKELCQMRNEDSK